jgi:hypothetical protein
MPCNLLQGLQIATPETMAALPSVKPHGGQSVPHHMGKGWGAIPSGLEPILGVFEGLEDMICHWMPQLSTHTHEAPEQSHRV